MKTFIKKSVYLLMLTVLCTIFLTSCDPRVNHLKQEDLQPIVEKVELIDYQNGTPQRIKKNEEILPFAFEKAEVLETLDNSKIDEFLEDFTYLSFLQLIVHDRALGKAIKITLQEGEVIICCLIEMEKVRCGFTAIYYPDGALKYYLGRLDGETERYSELIEKYFGEVK